jgi:hypothetical protein
MAQPTRAAPNSCSFPHLESTGRKNQSTIAHFHHHLLGVPCFLQGVVSGIRHGYILGFIPDLIIISTGLSFRWPQFTRHCF